VWWAEAEAIGRRNKQRALLSFRSTGQARQESANERDSCRFAPDHLASTILMAGTGVELQPCSPPDKFESFRAKGAVIEGIRKSAASMKCISQFLTSFAKLLQLRMWLV
jgi:hypothetical protein